MGKCTIRKIAVYILNIRDENKDKLNFKLLQTGESQWTQKTI
jgi:hypothetical protein